MSEGMIKGTIMAEVVKFVRKNKERARQILPEHLHHYFNSRILSTSWHPEEDYLELMGVVVKLRPKPNPAEGLSAWQAAGRASSDSAFEGAYRSLLRPGDPGRTLTHFPALWRLRHDTGDARVELMSKNTARIELRDYALPPGESCELVEGTIWGFLHHSEAEGIELAHTRCRGRGDEVCEWTAKWS
jgi:hypothetical protein